MTGEPWALADGELPSRLMVGEDDAEQTATEMQPLRAKVHNGRLVLDEPTDLPEGEVVYLHLVEAEVGQDDDFDDDEERAALMKALDNGIAAARNGEHVDADEFVRELLAPR